MEQMGVTVTQDMLAQGLQAIGIREGDMVYVHTSMKQIGWIEGGPKTLLEAFLQVLGEKGTLAVPTHTYSYGQNPPYAPGKTPTDLGKFPETVWRDSRALRSGHASHSSAAIGANAAYLTQNHDPRHALGFDSPLHRLYRSGGRILLLGVTHTANTSLHLAESMAGVPYTKLHFDDSWGKETYAVQPDGEVIGYVQHEYPGCSSAFDRIAPLLSPEACTKGKIGAADAMLLDARVLIDTTVSILHQTPDFLLCDNVHCTCCPNRRRMLQSHPN